jgi:RNA polymerase primary sigma factor
MQQLVRGARRRIEGGFLMVTMTMYDRCRSKPARGAAGRGSGRRGLSRDEEYELAARAAAGDRGARNHLVQANLGLVVAIAQRFLDRGLDLDDLVGEGNLGLIRAAEEFDPRFGTRFGTYAVCWIKQAIRHALMHTASTIRLPERMVGLLMKWRRAEWALGRDLGRPANFDEIASHLELSEAKRAMVARALEAARIRSGSRCDDHDGGGLSGIVVDRHGPAEDGVQAQEERAVAWRLMTRLKDRERTVVMLRFGLEGEPLTLEEIGRRLGVTRERVRQLETDALRKLAAGRTDARRDPRRDGRTVSTIGGTIAR